MTKSAFILLQFSPGIALIHQSVSQAPCTDCLDGIPRGFIERLVYLCSSGVWSNMHLPFYLILRCRQSVARLVLEVAERARTKAKKSPHKRATILEAM